MLEDEWSDFEYGYNISILNYHDNEYQFGQIVWCGNESNTHCDEY